MPYVDQFLRLPITRIQIRWEMLWEKDSNNGSDLEGETGVIASEKIDMYLKI